MAKYIAWGSPEASKKAAGNGLFLKYREGSNQFRFVKEMVERTVEFDGEEKTVLSCVAIDLLENPPRVGILDIKPSILKMITEHMEIHKIHPGSPQGTVWHIKRTGSSQTTTRYTATAGKAWPIPQEMVPALKEVCAKLEEIACQDAPLPTQAPVIPPPVQAVPTPVIPTPLPSVPVQPAIPVIPVPVPAAIPAQPFVPPAAGDPNDPASSNFQW